jgi:hypothetical protein
MPDTPHSSALRRIFVLVLAVALMVGALVVFLLLKRLPLPARIVVASSDFVAGFALLLLMRRQAGDRRSR